MRWDNGSARRTTGAQRNGRGGIWRSSPRRPLACEQLESRHLLSITVDTLLDVNADDGQTTLREAIAAAAPGDTIDFHPSLTSGGPAAIALSSLGELVIAKSLTIAGPGADLLSVVAHDPTPAENNGDGTRVLSTLGGNVKISGLRLTGGDVSENGGAIYNLTTLTLEQVDIVGNAAEYAGGGISSAGGNLTVKDCTIRDNSAGHSGGGLSITFGNTTVVDSTIRDNSAPIYGGGIDIYQGLVIVTGSAISANSTTVGGGINNWQGNLTVAHSTVSGNPSGGGIFIFGNEFTGGVAAIRHSTITGNADYGVASSDEFTQSQVYSSIIAGNTTSDVDGKLDSLGYNLVGTGSATADFDAAGDQVIGTDDPLLGPLQGNGGPTETHALLPGSPAIDAGNPADVGGEGDLPLFDQRGNPYSRVVGARVDVGAFEYGHYLVDTLLDEDDGNYGPGDFSLREAIAVASTAMPPAAIVFDPALTAGGPATIQLSGLGDLVIGKSLSIEGPGAELLTIAAYDPTPGEANGDGSRVFLVDDALASAVDVAIRGLRLTGADSGSAGGAIHNAENLTLDAMLLEGNRSAWGGGVNNEGNLTVAHSTIRDNGASTGGGIQNTGLLSLSASTITGNAAAFDGGGIYSFASGGPHEVHLVDSTVSGNTGQFAGGIRSEHSGILSIAGSTISDNGGLGLSSNALATLTGSTISGNAEGGVLNNGEMTITSSTITGHAGGGGIVNASGVLSVVDSTISGNTAGPGSNGGGGIANVNGGVLTVTRSTVAGNAASGFSGLSGGGIRNFFGTSVTLVDSTVSDNVAAGVGGGIASNAGMLTIVNSTISGNAAGSLVGGGGIFAQDGNVQVRHSTITNNSAADGAGVLSAKARTEVYSSIIAGNGSSDVADHAFLPPGGPGSYFRSLGYNLVGSGSSRAAFNADSDITGIEPLLGPLADNGGATWTHALLPGSPAIEAGDPAAVPGVGDVPLLDQRGAGRRFSLRMDIGAYEYQGYVVDTLVDESDGNYGPGDLSLREAIFLANAAADADSIVFHPALAGGTILLTLGELTITQTVSIEGPGASQLTVAASDPTPELDNEDGHAIVVVNGAAQGVRISGLRLTGADSPLNGGAVINFGELTLDAMLIEGNYAFSGGGICNWGGTLTVIASTIRDNKSNFLGGGVRNENIGTLTLIDSLISDNSSFVGGGLYTSSFSVTTLVNTTLSGNTAAVHGAIGADNGAITVIRHSTITANTGGASSAVSIGYSNARLDVYSSIIAGNGPSDIEAVDGGTVVSYGYNLVGTGSAVGAFNAAGDQSGVANPLLEPLADNGGPTLTHALLPASPAANAGDPAAVAGANDVPLYDQRGSGHSRVLGGRIDIGAFERAPFSAEIVDRHLFYNQSAYDGAAPGNLAANLDDNLAISGKTPYLAGDGLFPVSSMTSYTRGINGIMVDLQGTHGTITADDFIFRTSNTGIGPSGPNNTPDSWDLAPPPREVITLPDTPALGIHRVLITWDSGSIVNRYLQINMLANGNTGLAAAATWYYGNKVGETFVDPGANWNTGAADESLIRNNSGANVDIFNPFDIDKNKFAGAAVDQQSARAPNLGLMTRINIAAPAAPQGAAELASTDSLSPAAAEGGAGSAIASALTVSKVETDGTRYVPVTRSSDLAPSARALLHQPPATNHQPLLATRVQADLAKAAAATDAALDDELIDALLDDSTRRPGR